jgi:hypothetical protein
MNSRAGLIPVVITDKNGVTAVRWMKPATAPTAQSSIPPVNAVPRYTFAGTIRELKSLGVEFDGRNTPYGVKLLAKYDHEMLHRIMTAVRETDETSRSVWATSLGSIDSRDSTKRGEDLAIIHLTRIMGQYERLLAINPIEAAVMHASGHQGNRVRFFQTMNNAVYIENQTGINPGDADYDLVQANLIHVAVTRPQKYGPDEVQLYLQTHRDDINYIADHLNDAIRLIPELHERQDASRENIKAMLSVNPVLVDGAL